jgi:sugar-phosphatase
MDGVLIDSEPLWRKAMIQGFTDFGMNFTEDDCRKTTGMRFKEVVEYWLKFYELRTISVTAVEKKVIAYLIQLIEANGKEIEGVLDVLNFAKESNLKIGLATSSDNILVEAVLNKLQIHTKFDAIVSAEKMQYGKPHPEVFLTCAKLLNTNPTKCLVIEDSVNGVIAAKAAQMIVITVPDIDHKFNKQFAVANYQCNDMKEVLRLFKEIKTNSIT